MSQHRQPEVNPQFDQQVAIIARVALERLAKWRVLFTGWQLGTRLKGDPESDAVRDINEARILLRADVNALTGILIKKGIFSEREWTAQVAEEADALNDGFAKRFPGITADIEGLHMKLPEALETMRKYRFKP